MKDKLVEDLTAARQIYDKDVRLGAVVAVDALIQHLEALGVDRKLWAPLVGLSGALGDAIVGVHNPHTAVEKPKAGPRRPIQDETSKAWAAAAVSLLTIAGDTLPQALRRVAPLIGMSPAELKNFRKRLTRDNGQQVRPELSKAYDTAIMTHKNDPDVAAIATALGKPIPSPRQAAEAAMETIVKLTAMPNKPAS
ncbi:MAG: hypothetical protein E5X53_12500 [Mesorhizobium sp.]|uniref:hypothetical protein n=1 Tax=Mesorhizobium sp. TaxID=1871066 RepID=UPI0012107CAC|nr:hypothetical protein [Mesorhizobium sp.]TIP74854.1 MAG: hypothetical protein E5X55_07870 [Mesorhizobium sp.]TIQ14634.1 MAG: hypothetical protein E5X57_04045 [Mesorhizobium sp.]TIR52183.1 MAG: hypothetical protein E5X53_12500 [Mesorhizobium sp.]TJV96261.1 MAG: hypothetical protein E5X52_19620 [Mesorhizobium sp.]